MAITTLDGLIAAFPAFGFPIFKGPFTNQAANSWGTLFTVAGIPGVGSNSSDGVNGGIPTDATAGAYPFTNSNSSYLGRISAFSTQIGQLTLYDRLWHNSGLSVTSTGNQAISPAALTRPDANGADVEAWLQVYTTLGAGSTAKTIAYTDQDGNTAQVGTLVGFVTTASAGRNFPFSLAAGDTGVRAITGFDNVATSTSGTFGLVLRRQIANMFFAQASTGTMLDAITGGLPRIYDDACLEFLWLGGTATTTITGQITMVQG